MSNIEKAALSLAQNNASQWSDITNQVTSITGGASPLTDIKGTTQYITFNADGTVQKVQHKNSSNVVVREDVFTYATSLITEVRTLNTGQTITFKFHTDTKVMEVI